MSNSDGSAVSGSIHSKAFDQNVKTLEKGVVSEYAHSQKMHQFVEKLLVGKCIAVVQTFGDQMLVAGPLGGHMGQHAEEQTHRAVREAFKLIQYLLQADHHFSAAISLETAVSVLTHSDYPSFDMYGPAVSLARALVAEAPTTMTVATERIANVYSHLREANEGMAKRSQLEVCPAQSWRIRAGGHHRVQRLQLKGGTGPYNSASATAATSGSMNIAGAAYKRVDKPAFSFSEHPSPSSRGPDSGGSTAMVEIAPQQSSSRSESPSHKLASDSRSTTAEYHSIV
jgi:hypothetical protein